MIKSLAAEKTFNKTPTLLYDKSPESLEETKDIRPAQQRQFTETPRINTNLNRERFKAILLNSGTRQGFHFLLYLFNLVLELLARAVR